MPRSEVFEARFWEFTMPTTLCTALPWLCRDPWAWMSTNTPQVPGSMKGRCRYNFNEPETPARWPVKFQHPTLALTLCVPSSSHPSLYHQCQTRTRHLDGGDRNGDSTKIE